MGNFSYFLCLTSCEEGAQEAEFKEAFILRCPLYLCRLESGIPLSPPYSPFSWVAQSCLTLCSAMDCSMPGLPVHHQLPEFTQTHVNWFDDAIQPSHPLSSRSLPAINLPQHQGLFRWISSSHQVTKVLELQHQSFQWIFWTYFLYDGLVGTPWPYFTNIKSFVWALPVTLVKNWKAWTKR